ncbi:DNA polymerase III subunit gamma/tau [Peptoniphilus stercorisuis]|uniref:DNA-directed DNA polymerase n=1 Tax=Peptoniphilus stercorisuis TaxID=1436965 RepID=A0ABS4KB66_9FIRM|nr:DNA polymerase III subunit gamma/tau [Peptoniphilus stercorisuis]MBP2025031.1 DNA polymerase-3 subunit gamma/tau [Peptoniphilus stercorisuis]
MYQALYRKYRSKTFDELVGQDHITSALKHQIASGETSHAYLFSGTRGTGKTSAAKIFARGINCPNEVDGNPCNECPSCKGILEDRIMDVVEMDAASNNGVDDIRELKEKVIYPPSTSKYKVYIIDEVHMLSKGAFNALLKILEEPPRHLIFILATTEPEKIPQTILSRTQRFNFKRISPDIIVENLKKITELENKTCDEEVYKLIANNSDGAMRDALSLLDQCLSYGEDNIDYKLATDILGISTDEILFTLSSHLINYDIDNALITLEEIYKSGKDISNLISDLILHFRNLMITKTVKNPLELLYTSNIDKYKEQCEEIEINRIIEILKILNETLVSVKYAPDKRVIFEMSLIKISNTKDELSLKDRVEQLENMIQSGNIKKTNISKDDLKYREKEVIKKEPIQTENQKIIAENRVKRELEEASQKKESSDIIKNGKVTLDLIKSHWEDILIEIKDLKRLNVSALLREATLSDFNQNTLIVVYDEKFMFHYKAISTEDNIEFLREFFSKKYNEKIDVRIEIADTLDKKKAISKVESYFGKENIDRI